MDGAALGDNRNPTVLNNNLKMIQMMMMLDNN
jgi:hypothetical protein